MISFKTERVLTSPSPLYHKGIQRRLNPILPPLQPTWKNSLALVFNIYRKPLPREKPKHTPEIELSLVIGQT